MDSYNISDEDKNDLLRFLTNINCLDPIKERADKFNIFDVFGFARNEIRHSFFLRWLLDPKENHCLDDQFIRSLIACLVSSEQERYGKSAFPLLLMDCSDFIVQRETNDIDLLLLSKSNRVAVIIENKIGSHEHPSTGFESQLVKYKEFSERVLTEYDTKIYVYLSPQGELPSDSDWQSLSYLSVVEIIEDILNDNKDRLSLEVKMLIQNYIDIVRRDIVEDEELNRICNDIYNNHKNALDLIYNHSNMGKNPTQLAIIEALKEMNSLGLIVYDSKVHDTFYTMKMTAFLPDLSEPKSNWNNTHVYRYWIERDGEKVTLVFDVSNKGVEGETKKKIVSFFNTKTTRGKDRTDTYNRIHTCRKKEFDLSKFDYDDKKTKIKELIQALLDEKEDTWIKACKEDLDKHI